MMENIREPAVAGMFYPDDVRELTLMVADLMSNAKANDDKAKAIIAPHAGYVYSGPIAASAYAFLSDCAGTIERVVLLGPAHRVSIDGLAVSSAESFATPIGTVAIDKEAVLDILTLPQVTVSDDAHAAEHSLEVHLPFLQTICPGLRLVPLVVGRATADEVEEVLEQLWGGSETVIIVSSDLSHFYDYATAHTLDSATAEAIEELNPKGLRYDSACGQVAIKGLLQAARKRGLTAKTIDLRNSGDTAGPLSRVVGYGAFVFS